MTILVAVKTNVDSIDAVVLGSDTQMSLFDEDGKPTGKKPFYKIVCGEFWALAHTGLITDDLRTFYNKLTKPKWFKDFDENKIKEMISKALDKKRFLEVDELNAQFYKKSRDKDETHEFLLAVNQPFINLYHVDPFGNLNPPNEGMNYLILGRGSEGAENYIKEKIEMETYDSANVDLKTAFKLCRGALKRSETDIYSGGPMDFVVVRKEGIFSHGRRIRKSLESAESKEFENIIDEEINRGKIF